LVCEYAEVISLADDGLWRIEFGGTNDHTNTEVDNILGLCHLGRLFGANADASGPSVPCFVASIDRLLELACRSPNLRRGGRSIGSGGAVFADRLARKDAVSRAQTNV
jgi:hypothetical protein